MEHLVKTLLRLPAQWTKCALKLLWELLRHPHALTEHSLHLSHELGWEFHPPRRATTRHGRGNRRFCTCLDLRLQFRIGLLEVGPNLVRLTLEFVHQGVLGFLELRLVPSFGDSLRLDGVPAHLVAFGDPVEGGLGAEDVLPCESR